MKAIIILAAGKPHIEDNPSIIFKIFKKNSILNFIKSSFKSYTNEIVLVSGFKNKMVKDKFINIKNLKLLINHDWKKTGNFGSLLKCDIKKYKEIIVLYSDIIFDQNLCDELIKSKNDVTFFHSQFYKNQIKYKEKFRIKKGQTSQFVGVVKFKRKVINLITRLKDKKKEKFSKLNILEFIQLLKKFKIKSIKKIDIENRWVEFTNLDSIKKFLIQSKAETLKIAKTYLKKSIVYPQVSFTVKEWNTDRKEILNRIENINSSVIIRSSSLDEDGFFKSNAGKYLSLNNVNIDKKSITLAVNRVIKSYSSKNVYNQVLVQPEAKNLIASGVVFTRALDSRFPYYVINYDRSKKDTSGITSGKSKNSITHIIYKNQTSLKNIRSKILKKILTSIQEVEKVFLNDSLDIEFAINEKNQIIIFQVRPLAWSDQKVLNDTTIEKIFKKNEKKFSSKEKKSVIKKSLYGVMPDWNPAEIIGFKPKPLAFSLYEELITDKVWAVQRKQFGYRNVKNKKLLTDFFGTPYVDLIKTFESFVPAKLPQIVSKKLINFYYNSLSKNQIFHDKVEFEIIPTCYTSEFEKWSIKLKKYGFKKTEILMFENSLKEITKKNFLIYKKNNKKILDLKNNLKLIKKKKVSARKRMELLILECKKNGTLPFAHIARSAFVSTSILRDAVKSRIISEKSSKEFFNSINTINSDFLNDAFKVKKRRMSFISYKNKYGHLRPGTYDINSKSYFDNSAKLLKMVVARSENEKKLESIKNWKIERKNLFNFLLKKKLFVENPTEVEKNFKNSIADREYSKFYFTRYVSEIFNQIRLIGKKYNINDDDLSFLTINDLTKKIDKKRMKNIIIKNKKKYNSQVNFTLPYLVSKFQNFKNFELIYDIPNYVGNKNIVGKMIYLLKNMRNEKEILNKIVLIESADPGYDWIFSCNIKGLVTKFGGANSHMAIRANEFNIPAAIGIGEKKFNEIKFSSMLKIDPINQTLLKI